MTETIEAHDLLHGEIIGVVETHTLREVFVSALRIRIDGMSCADMDNTNKVRLPSRHIDISAARGGELLIRLVDEE